MKAKIVIQNWTTLNLYRYWKTTKLEDILVINGRLRYGKEIPGETKNSKIIDIKYRLTKLLIIHYHNRNHQGPETLLTELRRKFWIINGRTTVRNTCRKCVPCRIQKGKPRNPQMSPLPDYRLFRQEMQDVPHRTFVSPIPSVQSVKIFTFCFSSNVE